MHRTGAQKLARGLHLRSAMILGALLAIGLTSSACGGGTGSASTTTTTTTGNVVHVGGTSNGWVFHDGQTVRVSMGPNHLFHQYSHVNIVQCSDPGGKTSNLPTKFLDCDENTIQGDTVLVGLKGSFSESGYMMFKLPSSVLSESKSGQPVCDQTHMCVLLVSEYQTDLNKPKAFSHAFTVLPASGSNGGS